jgi:hypothetical protein
MTHCSLIDMVSHSRRLNPHHNVSLKSHTNILYAFFVSRSDVSYHSPIYLTDSTKTTEKQKQRVLQRVIEATITPKQLIKNILRITRTNNIYKILKWPSYDEHCVQ